MREKLSKRKGSGWQLERWGSHHSKNAKKSKNKKIVNTWLYDKRNPNRLPKKNCKVVKAFKAMNMKAKKKAMKAMKR